MRFVGSLIAVVVVVATACPAPEKKPDPLPTAPPGPVMSGKFVSEGCIAVDNPDGTSSYLKLTVEMSPTTWAMDRAIYVDEKCTAKSGTVHEDGAYTVLGPSAKVPGAFELEKSFAKVTATPHVDGFIAMLQSAGCGKAPYAVNEPQDLLASGCKDLGLQPSSSCATEHDIVLYNAGNTIAFGKRPADNNLCATDKRPVELDPTVLKKQ